MVRRYLNTLEFQFMCAIFLNEVFQYLNCTIFKVIFDNEEIFINKEKTAIVNLFIRRSNSTMTVLLVISPGLLWLDLSMCLQLMV